MVRGPLEESPLGLASPREAGLEKDRFTLNLSGNI